MKYSSMVAALALAVCMAAHDADAARRFGGGGNLGKQRPAPTATKDSAAATPAPTQPAQGAPASPTAAAPTLPPPKPGFMSRWGGLLAGLGIGALLASLFGAQMGPIIGLILAGLLVAFIVFALLRLLAARRQPFAATEPRVEPQMQSRTAGFQGIGSAIPQAASDAPPPASKDVPRRAPIGIPGFEVAPFVRVAKTSFIRLQAANDAGDLEDIRDYTTPEMYAEISMKVKERGTEPQRTEVVSLDADVVGAVVEGDYEMASVRFWGLIRENDAANPEPFDEIWHVRKKAGDRKAPWLIAGIQQAA